MKKVNQKTKPEIYSYFDHILFLKDWIHFLKATDSLFSTRELAKQSGVAIGYVSMVLSRKRSLTEKAEQKLLPHLKLSAQEIQFFSLLRTVGESEDPKTRLDAIHKMSKFKKFKNSNEKEHAVYEYLTKWHYVCIREMTFLKDFELNANWIQANINVKLSLKEIDEAIHFLKERNLIEFDVKKNQWKSLDAHLDCREGIFKISLGQFHRQALSLAADSIDNTSREKRLILGHTVALKAQDLEKIRDILSKAMEDCKNAVDEKNNNKDDVYHVEIAAFPLTRKMRK